jgi:ABC-type antimicrobial peptide transport system permease subunit
VYHLSFVRHKSIGQLKQKHLAFEGKCEGEKPANNNDLTGVDNDRCSSSNNNNSNNHISNSNHDDDGDDDHDDDDDVGVGFNSTTISDASNLNIQGSITSAYFMHHKFTYFTTTFILCVLTILVGYFVPDLSLVLSVVGSTGSTLITFIIPGYLYYSLHNNNNNNHDNNNNYNHNHNHNHNNDNDNDYIDLDKVEDNDNDNDNDNKITSIHNSNNHIKSPCSRAVELTFAMMLMALGCVIMPLSLTFIFL